MTLKLKPEVEAQLTAQAEASGMSLEEYIFSLLEGAVQATGDKQLSPDERAAAFEAWSARHRPTPPLSDFAVSREGMYEDPKN